MSRAQSTLSADKSKQRCYGKLLGSEALIDISTLSAVTYTGADFYALSADAWQRAALREVARLEAIRQAGGKDEQARGVVVTQVRSRLHACMHSDGE